VKIPKTKCFYQGGNEKMKRMQYSKGMPYIMMPAANLSADEKAKIDNVTFKIEELTADHVVYALWQGWMKTFNNLLAIVGEFSWDALGKKVAKTLGARQGYAQLCAFLKGKGVKRGTPELQAEYQDMLHVLRGPAHAAALWAEFDDTRCVIRRNRCLYSDGRPPGTGQCLNDYIEGFYEGYVKADPGLEKVTHTEPCCNCENCEMVFLYKSR
jgi:hypothetical protein